jgi:ABC-type uncharacterized transport system auxiliary subunit
MIKQLAVLLGLLLVLSACGCVGEKKETTVMENKTTNMTENKTINVTEPKAVQVQANLQNATNKIGQLGY